MRFPNWLAASVLVAGSIACAAWPGNARAAGEFSAGQKTAVEKIVHDYLIANPEVVREAIEELEKRQKADEANMRGKVVADKAATLFNSPNQAVVGNPKGDVTLVEFFDYNCGYCKRSVNTVAKLIEGDPKLRVVLKDFAILGPDSVETALVANAARMQFSPEKFWEFHRKLLETKGHIGKQQAMAVAKRWAPTCPASKRISKSRKPKRPFRRSAASPMRCALTAPPPGWSEPTRWLAACPTTNSKRKSTICTNAARRLASHPAQRPAGERPPAPLTIAVFL